MNSARIITLVNDAATGRASIPQLRELSALSLRQLLTARRRYLADHRHRAGIAIPTVRVVRVIHALLQAFLSRSTASHAPVTHTTTS